MQKIGMVLSADYLPVHQLLKFAPIIDKLGYAQISVPEIWGHDSVSLISALSQLTNNVKLSSGIINIFSRTAGLTAMTAASLSELSNGRFILGLGASGPKVIENFHGISFNKPLKRTKEYVDVLRTLLAGKRLAHDTTQIGKLRGFKLSFSNFKPVPIHIAALGPKNIRQTAEIADGWIPVIMPIEAFREEVKRIKVYIHDKNDFEVTPFVLSIIGDDPERLNLLRGHMAYYFGGMGTFYNNMLRRLGFVDEAENILDLWQKGKPQEAAAAVTDELLAQTCVFGSKDEAQERLINIIKAGATTPLLTIPFKTKTEYALETYQSLAPANLSL